MIIEIEIGGKLLIGLMWVSMMIAAGIAAKNRK